MPDNILDDDFGRPPPADAKFLPIIRWWESRRLLYNAILLIFSLILIVFDLPVFQQLSLEDWVLGLGVLAVGANLAYLMGWGFELLLAFYLDFYLDDFKRWVLWLSGIVFSIAVVTSLFVSLFLSTVHFSN